METAMIVHWGYMGIMEKKMESTIVNWGYIRDIVSVPIPSLYGELLTEVKIDRQPLHTSSVATVFAPSVLEGPFMCVVALDPKPR